MKRIFNLLLCFKIHLSQSIINSMHLLPKSTKTLIDRIQVYTSSLISIFSKKRTLKFHKVVMSESKVSSLHAKAYAPVILQGY